VEQISVVLQTFVVGAELALVTQAHPGILPCTFTLLVRFVIMPALSIAFVWGTAGRGWYVKDELVWSDI
jgi:auxin efflux carrier family protein